MSLDPRAIAELERLAGLGSTSFGEAEYIVGLLPDLLRERRELLIKARVAGDIVRFRETPDLSKEVDEATDEGLDMDHANLASHYACAIANWNVTLDARDEAQKRVAELEMERRKLLTMVADLHSRIAGDMLALGNDELAEKHEATAAEWREKATEGT